MVAGNPISGIIYTLMWATTKAHFRNLPCMAIVLPATWFQCMRCLRPAYRSLALCRYRLLNFRQFGGHSSHDLPRFQSAPNGIDSPTSEAFSSYQLIASRIHLLT